MPETEQEWVSIKFTLATTTISPQGEHHTSIVEKMTHDRKEMIEYLRGVIEGAEAPYDDDD